MSKSIIVHGKYSMITCSCGCQYTFDSYDVDSEGNVTCPECGTSNKALEKPTKTIAATEPTPVVATPTTVKTTKKVTK